jgi:hypothetical protein
MAIWDFGSFETDDLERLEEIDDELKEMGLDLFTDEMRVEVQHELSKRSSDEMDTMMEDELPEAP